MGVGKRGREKGGRGEEGGERESEYFSLEGTVEGGIRRRIGRGIKKVERRGGEKGREGGGVDVSLYGGGGRGMAGEDDRNRYFVADKMYGFSVWFI